MVPLSTIIQYFGLSKDAQVVHMEERHNYNDGEFATLYILDGEEVLVKDIKMTSHPLYCVGHDVVCEDEEVISRAEAIYKAQGTDIGKYAKYVGCSVILSRSRKAPNGEALEVVDYREAGFNRWNYRTPEQIQVTDGEEYWWVSSSCISKVVRGLGFR